MSVTLTGWHFSNNGLEKAGTLRLTPDGWIMERAGAVVPLFKLKPEAVAFHLGIPFRSEKEQTAVMVRCLGDDADSMIRGLLQHKIVGSLELTTQSDADFQKTMDRGIARVARQKLVGVLDVRNGVVDADAAARATSAYTQEVLFHAKDTLVPYERLKAPLLQASPLHRRARQADLLHRYTLHLALHQHGCQRHPPALVADPQGYCDLLLPSIETEGIPVKPHDATHLKMSRLDWLESLGRMAPATPDLGPGSPEQAVVERAYHLHTPSTGLQKAMARAALEFCSKYDMPVQDAMKAFHEYGMTPMVIDATVLCQAVLTTQARLLERLPVQLAPELMMALRERHLDFNKQAKPASATTAPLAPAYS